MPLPALQHDKLKPTAKQPGQGLARGSCHWATRQDEQVCDDVWLYSLILKVNSITRMTGEVAPIQATE